MAEARQAVVEEGHGQPVDSSTAIETDAHASLQADERMDED